MDMMRCVWNINNCSITDFGAAGKNKSPTAELKLGAKRAKSYGLKFSPQRGLCPFNPVL
jgi:hypothetical protein